MSSCNLRCRLIFLHGRSWTYSIQFNSIQFNTDICVRQLINYRVGTHDEQNDKMSVTQVGVSRKKVSFQFSFKTVQLFNCQLFSLKLFRVAQMHWGCIPGCGRTKRSRIHVDLSSWFSSGGLIATVQVSQLISDERAPWRACRDRTDSEEQVRVGICIPTYTVWIWRNPASRASATAVA